MRVMRRLQTLAFTANPAALLAFGVAAIAGGVLLATGTYGGAWRSLVRVLHLMGAHPILFAFATTALLAFVGAGIAWSESRR